MSMSDKPERADKRGANAAPVHYAPSGSSESGKLLFWKITSSVLFLAVIVLVVLLYFSKSSLPLPAVLGQPQVQETPAAICTAWCYTPLEEVLSVSGPAGEAVALPDGPQIEGYTFLGWADDRGTAVESGEVTLFSDAAFSAVYAIAFRNESAQAHHTPYLSLDGEGLFHPSGTVSRGEAAELLYAALDTKFVGSSGFADVDPAASYSAAAATLKDLGVVDGSRFHPADPISLGELFEMLAHFFPKSAATYSFSEIPEDSALYNAFCLAMERGWISELSVSPEDNLTRAEAAHILNSLRGRAPVAETDFAKVGTILDVSFSDPCFWDIAEAAIAHDAVETEAGEIWTASEPLPLYSEGTFFIGTALHCVDERGSAVVNGSYGGLDFGPDGVVTTGMPELDKLVQETLVALNLNPAVMERERMLYIIFNYVTYHNSYLRDRNNIHEIGDTSWKNDAAYHMLTTHKGNCYNYAAEFYVLARAIGYDAVIYSGTIDPTASPHGWVEIEMDGEWYIFDTEIEYKEVTINNRHSSYYRVPYWKAATWYYYRGEEIEAEIAARG